MATYLIAGAGGNLGSRLVKHLLGRGERVLGIVRDPLKVSDLEELGMAVWQGDITDYNSIEGAVGGMEFVVNVVGGFGDPEFLENTYVTGNRNLLRACAIAGEAAAYLFTNHIGVYGGSGEELLTEDSPLRGMGPINETAIRAGEAIRSYHAPGKLDTIELRVGGILSDRGNWRARLSDPNFKISAPQAWTSFIHIDDIVRAIEAALEFGRQGSPYNVVDDEPVQQIDFYTSVAGLLSIPVPPVTPGGPNIFGSLRVNNAKFKQECNFMLRYPTYRESMKAILQPPAEIHHHSV
ncbi:MAG: NAD-dependent epimerase/dehydratase family protein [Chloroflexi bacterium]|nr:NAD-dependent epimerase/dehydratase family protein [Chloroflexota bacterium]